jgi:FtsP/CotA-like multicopper oxidase with cupredoxin domain
MHRTAVLPSLPFPVILAALSLAPGPGRSSSPNYHGFAAPISHVAVVAKAGPLVCRRPPPGSVVSDPPAFFSHGGKLNIDLDYISSVDGKGRRLFCFVTPGGLESPTLHVRPGDWLNIHLTNKVDPSLHAEPGAMAMIMGPDRCGAATMNATSVNMHFHGTNASPTCHADEVIHTLVNSGESFDYHVKIPGSQPPGLYWYHPHVHGQSEAAVKGGASGAMVVDGIENLAPIVAGLPERTLIVRDQIVSGDSPPGGAAPTSDVTLNYVPIAYPALTPAVIRIKPGRKEFWRVLNASAETVLDVALTYDGVEQPMKVVALDGVATGSRYGTSAGKVLTMSHIVIPAAGRAEFVVTGPPASVQGATLATRSIAMGPDGDIDIARPLARLEVDRAAGGAGHGMPAPTALAPHGGAVDLDTASLTARRKLYFSEILADPYDPSSQPKYFITVDGAKPHVFNPADPPSIVTTEGAVEEWTLENRSREMHEFHIHQIHFKLVARDGERLPQDQQQYLDTTQIPFWSGKGPYPSITVLMDFRGVTGDILYHCHMLDHEDGGMMAILRILPRGSKDREHARKLIG